MTAYCVFEVGDSRVGISMAHVREIIDSSQINAVAVPLAPGFMRGLFNLRGQILPCFDLSRFVGSNVPAGGTEERAVVVVHGNFRFAAPGHRINTQEVDESVLQPLADAALFPALDTQAVTERGSFRIIHLDRLEACLNQALRFNELAEAPLVR